MITGMMSRGIGRRAAIVLAILVLALLLGVVTAESLNGSSKSGPSFSQSPQSTSPDDVTPLENLTQFVNPFIGTGDSAPYPCGGACGGDTFPGAVYPMGMVQWSPDTVSNPPGGYYYGDSVIKDFSLTHFSGRGCEVYQDIPFVPYVGDVSVSPAAHASLYYSSFSHASEAARPGFYRVHLDGPNVTAELSATPRTGMGEFVYPASEASTMIINAGGSVNGNSNSRVTVNPASDEVTGSAESTVGCGSNSYVTYFAAKFDRSFASYGTRVSGPQVGAIAVMGRRGGGHVGIITGIDSSGNPIMISGNNGNRVREAAVSRGRIYAYVMPN